MNSIKDWLTFAQEERFAIGAFNVANLETLKAVVNAADKLSAPVIIEASPGESTFVGIRQLRYLINAYHEETGLPIFLNLDHSHDVEVTKESIAVGFDLIHFDGSEFDLEENKSALSELVPLAHAHDLVFEGEMDHIQGSSADHRQESLAEMVDTSKYTNPEKAAEFVEETGIDIFAAFFGNVHGVYDEAPKLDFDRLREIREHVSCFLSMHGGSGIADQDVRTAIQVGKISKVNVNSEMRIAFRETLEHELNNTDEIAMYKIMPPVIDAVQKVVEQKIMIFGSEGKAKK
ncbi:class II fructose-bisphosphate aldolase [candidate division WWE3 bacterium]|uniref:Class II fructose-bisphosphate aldolase n=1 Tax=candidate division WWE3 bacterium TaxID=2053526 RepID=A0A955RQ08_UNCKA|nr:class II fructose-bisphosphate aldolase [candidate division WWE3 bacterium]